MHAERGHMTGLALILLFFIAPAGASELGSQERRETPGFWAPAPAPRARYKIECKIDLDHGSLDGMEHVHFKNPASIAITRLAIAWELARQGDLSDLKVTIDGQAVSSLPDPITADGASLLVFNLPEPLLPGAEMVLDCSFRIADRGNSGSPANPLPHKRLDQVIMTDWHPRLWWGCPSVDDFAVKLDVSPDCAVGTSGRLNKQSGYYELTGARSFGIFLGGGHDVAEAAAGDVLVRCIYAPKAEPCARLLVATAVDVVNFYRQRFGFYPQRSLTIIPGADAPMGGWPAATALVGIHGQQRMAEKPRLHWQWITAHEIGHQYFGEHVLAEHPLHWLWIGMGIYADREYIRARGLGPDKHRDLVARYREGIAQGLDTTLERTPEQILTVGFDFNNIAQHGKGFGVISALACTLGQQTFDRIYLRCLKEFEGRPLGADAFQAVCEAESGQGLRWFFDQWVRSDRHLMYQIASQKCEQKDGQYVTRVRVECRGTLMMPVPVRASFEDGSSRVKFTDRLLKINEIEFVSAAPLQKAQLDPREELVMAVPTASAPSKDLSASVGALPWTGAGKRALDAFQAARAAELTHAADWGKLGLTLYDGEYYPEALKAFRRAADWSDTKDPWHFVAQVWQGHILDLGGHREEALQCYRAALKDPPVGPMRARPVQNPDRPRLGRATTPRTISATTLTQQLQVGFSVARMLSAKSCWYLAGEFHSRRMRHGQEENEESSQESRQENRPQGLLQVHVSACSGGYLDGVSAFFMRFSAFASPGRVPHVPASPRCARRLGGPAPR